MPDLIHQLRVAAAILEARELVSRLGESHPDALAAITRAVDLADPGFLANAAHECGISLPSPTHVNDDGEPLFSTKDIAAAVGVPHSDVLSRADDLREALPSPSVATIHRIQ